MRQGHNSVVEKVNHRVVKHIKYCEPYVEYHTLAKVSTLGPMFPQHVKAEGPCIVSYDYIDGITLREYLEDPNFPNLEQHQMNLVDQMLHINRLLENENLYWGDQVLDNFILDQDGIVHPIDFAYMTDHIHYDKLLYLWYRSGLIHDKVLQHYLDKIK